MTRFAGKYNLYLYREKGVDDSEQPTGVPVLFIPGHAGSYKQVRSIAAEATFYYYKHYAHDPEKWHSGVRNLDFFTVDFHEEFSALHGQSLLEQAEYLNDAVDYILKLYPQSRQQKYSYKTGATTTTSTTSGHKIETTPPPDPTSVIIIGHSMGGIVARTMFTMSNYQHGTINTVITMSTPHMLPPAPFDWQISKLYDDINQFWREGFSPQEQPQLSYNHNNAYPPPPHISLRDISIVSIAGGTLDNTVCSDSTNIGSIVPATHGFTVFTTAVPYVWTGSDHVSILNCNQFVKVIAKTLLDLVDVRRGSQTKALEERMQILRQTLLSGLEDRKGDGSDVQLGNLSFYNLPSSDVLYLNPGERWTIGKEPKVKMTFLPTVANADAFAILSDDEVHRPKDNRFELLLCSQVSTSTSPTPNITRVACRSVNSISVPVPASTKNDIHPFSGNTFSFGVIEFKEMGAYSYFTVLDKHAASTDGGDQGDPQKSRSQFLMVEPFKKSTHTQVIRQSMLSIALEGVHVKTGPGLFTSIHIPAIESPILAYHLKVSRPNCRSFDVHFAPFLRQSISTMHESKFYVNLADNTLGGLDETDVSIHGRSAFTSIVSASHDVDQNGLSFQIWMDPTCPEPVQLDLSIDWYGSAGRLGFRNGIMLATFSFITVMLVFAAQIRCYNHTGIYPHFGQGLSYCFRRSLPFVLLSVSICSILQCTTTTPNHYTLDDFWYLPSSTKRLSWQDIMNGNTDPFFWWIPLAGLAASIGVVSLLWLVVEGAIRLIAYLSMSFTKHVGLGFWSMVNRSQETKQQQVQRRALTTVILFLAVATFIPYQFVFVVAFLVQIVTCIRALIRYKVSSNQAGLRRLNRYNYLLSILLLFFTLLPFNLPILMVWIRNISVHWFVPFSSDHSVLAIAPFMIHVEILIGNRRMLPRQCNRSG
ncbi:PGAP1-like protein-domain-containing protein [Mycotypha africana]|uniref:PGAP1-like protein-domain-containing protein n=1 Tax=Mycotypha africana TaxID=64632 RepID=UPI002301E8F8|nr:PGAP1-like protein-domain-containing protein [Mycotypha africana]KAI8984029.1 PGAP1-like protein-domain-containing protein [Mycotypha africana]